MSWIDKMGVAVVGLGIGAAVWLAVDDRRLELRPQTSGECEAIGGMVAVFSSTDLPEALCLKKGQYWSVRVDAWSRYGRGSL